MRTEFLCGSVLRVASAPTVKLVSYKSALNPPVVYSAARSKAVVPVLVLLFVALWFVLRGDLLCVFPCVVLFLCFLVLLVLRIPRLGRGGGGGGEGGGRGRGVAGGGGGWSWCFSCVCSIYACLDLSVSSSSWGLGGTAVCDCGTPWTFLLPFVFTWGLMSKGC